MLFLIIEFTFVAVLGRVLQLLLDTSVLFDLMQPPPGHLYVPLYLWVSFRIFNYFIRREPAASRIKLTSAFCFKLVFSALMTYLSVNVYAGGDLQAYYTLPYWFAERILTFDWDAIKNITLVTGYFFRNATAWNATTVIAYTFTGVFLVFPPSLYGLTLLSGTVIFLATLKLFWLIEPHIEYRRTFFWMFFFAPSMALQMGYTGKETVIIPLLTGIIVLTQKRGPIWRRLPLLAGIYYIRFYQAFFILVAWVGARFTLRQIFSLKGLPFVAVALAASVYVYRQALDRLGGLGFDSILDLADFISVVYKGGNLVLKPWPFPLTYLQVFRPFPWEAHNMMALAVSMEFVVFLCVVGYLGATRFRVLRQRFKLDPFFRFLAIYTLIQVAVFSYNDNMGDLARRKIYFMPLLVGLVCYRKMNADELSAAAAGRRVRPGYRSSPPSPAAPPGNAAPLPPA